MKKKLAKLTLSRETVLNLEGAQGGAAPATGRCSGSCQESCLGDATCQAGFCYTQGCPDSFPRGIGA